MMLLQDVIFYYDFSDGYTTIARDRSGNNFDASVNNRPDFIPGPTGNYACDFIATSFTYVRLPTTFDTNIAKNSRFTTVGWVNTPSFTKFQTLLSNYYNGTTTCFLELRVDTSGTVSVFIGNDGNNYSNITTTAAITTNSWYHIAGLWKGGSSYSGLEVYLNGQLESATATDHGAGFDGTYTPSGSNTDIGRLAIATTNYSDAAMAEIGCWSRALTQGEIAALYNGSLTYPFGIYQMGKPLQRNLRGPSRSIIDYRSAGNLIDWPVYAAAAPTFQAGWARQKGTVIGGGMRS